MARSDPEPNRLLDPEQWVDRYGDRLFRYALARLRDRDAAEEVVQETLVAAFKAREQYSGRGSEGAWLMGICKRKVLDEIQRRNRPDAAAGTELGEDPAEAWFDAKGNWRSDPRLAASRPEAALERAEFWDAFRKCLSRLPQRQADVFTLRELDGLDSDQICKELAISLSNFWVLLHRARLRLTRCMKAYLEAGDG